MKPSLLRYLALAAFSFSILLPFKAIAASGVDSLFVDARGSFHQEILNGHYSSQMRADYLNLHIYGKINDSFTYRVRQRLNVWIDKQDPFRATDWMSLSWKATDKLTLMAGKSAILIGGYEYDSAPIDVYFYSQFCSNLSQYFAFGFNLQYEVAKSQYLTFQVCNSPLDTGFSEALAYNFVWTGGFAPWWETIWSLNFIEDPQKRVMNYIALGNHLLFNKVQIDVDFFHRASFKQQNFFLSDYSLIGKLIWRVGNWNICGKAGYESNDAANVNANGESFDTVLKAGTSYFYGGCGLEYFPLGNDDVRLHIAYYRDSFEHKDNLQIGLKWKFRIIGASK